MANKKRLIFIKTTIYQYLYWNFDKCSIIGTRKKLQSDRYWAWGWEGGGDKTARVELQGFGDREVGGGQAELVESSKIFLFSVEIHISTRANL